MWASRREVASFSGLLVLGIVTLLPPTSDHFGVTTSEDTLRRTVYTGNRFERTGVQHEAPEKQQFDRCWRKAGVSEYASGDGPG